MTLIESNNYRHPITADGTDTGTTVGSMNATVDNGNRSVNISFVLTNGATLPADNVIQQQITDFISAIRNNASASGLTMFADVTK